MKYLFFTVLIIPFLLSNAFCQQQVQIKQQAQISANAFVTGNYEKFSDYMYPKLIQIAGGRDSMISGIKKGVIDLNNKGIIIKNVAIGEPGLVYNDGDELHCVVPETLTLKVHGGYLISKGYWLAINVNKAQIWYFIDIGNIDAEKINAMFPNLNSKIIIPEHIQPVFVKDSI